MYNADEEYKFDKEFKSLKGGQGEVLKAT